MRTAVVRALIRLRKTPAWTHDTRSAALPDLPARPDDDVEKQPRLWPIILTLPLRQRADSTSPTCASTGGGANPSAQNKTIISGPVSATGTFSSGKNGQVTASLTLMPPDSGGFTCPSGQSLEIAQVTYTNVIVTDTTNGITEPVEGSPFDTGCLLPEVRGAS